MIRARKIRSPGSERMPEQVELVRRGGRIGTVSSVSIGQSK
jgi:hypothetical protein